MAQEQGLGGPETEGTVGCGRVLTALQLAVGGVLCAVGILHVSNSWVFLEDILAYRLVPFEMARWLAVLLPLFQLTIGVNLVFGVWLSVSFAMAAAMCGLFLLAEFSAMARALEISCGCFGPLSPTIGWQSTGLTAALLFASLTGNRIARKG